MADHSEETRRIYQAQHARIAADERAMRRFTGMFNEPYFHVQKGFFSEKKLLDAGCGNTAKLLIALYRMGCRDLHACDLGTDFIPAAQDSLAQHGIPKEAVKFSSGSVLKLPYDPEAFDFVCCHGVLLHVNSMEEARNGFRELARVTTHGGHLYTTFANVEGFFEDCLFPAARAYYRSNDQFRRLIDTIAPSHFAHLIDIVERGFHEHEGAKVDLSFLKDAFDTDFCVTIQNIIQVPVQLPISESFVREMYSETGFATATRLKRYVKRENIRRFFAPLHYVWEDELVSLIYGSGSLEFIARKL
jgi:2-polyprenyl-3-methyl-5-hydroxy-6-metoxy-1,4-benzoquinol methylase